MGRVYALLIGIDAYVGGPDVLEGCINDVDNVDDYLRNHCTDPAILKLTDADATYANVTAQIAKHLGQAGKDDVAYLHYSGHGSREGAAPEFAKFDLDKRDQTLVCVDSRVSDSNVDLADKELALLVQDIAKNDAHVAWVLDCCHSGSGTRDLDDSNRAGVRAAAANPYTRPFESYLGGRYAEMVKTGDLVIPQARHMLMAGCDRDETSKEDLDKHCGIFTESLYDVLRETGGDLSYAELFGRARARVAQNIARTNRTPQRPQFEAIGGFDGWQGFLGRARKIGRKTYVVSKAGEKWSVDAGAIAGLPMQLDKPVKLSLALETAPDNAVGTAQVVSVGGTKSEVSPDFAADPAVNYLATLTTMPDPPMRVLFVGDDASRAAVQGALDADGGMIAQLVGAGEEDDGFALTAGGGTLVLTRRDDQAVATRIQTSDAEVWPKQLIAALSHVAGWRRLLVLNNPQPQLDASKVDLVYALNDPDGSERVLPAESLTFDIEKQPDGKWGYVRGQLRVRNQTGTPLYYSLLQFHQDYSVDIVADGQIVSSDEYMTVPLVWNGKPATPWLNIFLDGDGVAAVEQFKLVLTTEPSDSFRLAMPPLTSDRGAGGDDEREAATSMIKDDWFTKQMVVRATPRLAAVGTAPAQLAGGKITVDGHPSITANLALVAPLGASRGLNSDDHFNAALAAAGITPVGIGGERGDSPAALDITDISDPSKLADNPLKVRLDMKLAPDEVLIPMVRDGAHLLPAGDFWRDADGSTHVEISQVPAPLVDQRSLTGSLRMYFFKAVGIDHINRLRLASFDDGGRASYATDGMVTAVKAASRVLVVIHGIIGDTRGMLEGLHACGLDSQFDCVLAYDYENLSTPIGQTARALKDDLAAAGIGADDGKTVTVLAHSMGGLVSRWMIEKEGGAAFIDHLVMCGTPNAGSPFGDLGKARKILLALMGLGASTGITIPYLGPIAGVLSASAKLTPTLEQMAPTSEFIKALNAGAPSTTRYTILAGNIDDYQAPDKAFFDSLRVKITRSAPLDVLFENAANDIAVKTHSILLDDVVGDHPATRANVACHHLNYFSCPAGQTALKAVVWH